MQACVRVLLDSQWLIATELCSSYMILGHPDHISVKINKGLARRKRGRICFGRCGT